MCKTECMWRLIKPKCRSVHILRASRRWPIISRQSSSPCWPGKVSFLSSLTLFKPAFFGSLVTRGGADLPPPSKNGGNGWEVQKLSWNLISYQDWCQTWGFTTFRYLEPPQLMVWKSDFFRRSMRFVRVPPYESWAKWTNFLSSWENGDFFWGQNCCTLFHTQNEEKSQKISTCIRIHTRVDAKTWWWGQICPPLS